MKADYVHKDSLTSTGYGLSFKMNDEEIKKLMNLLTQGGLRHFVLKLDDEELDVVEYKEYKKLEERIAYLERSIERKEENITELEQERVPYTNECVDEVKKENEELKKQLKEVTEDYKRMLDNFDSKVDVLTKIAIQQQEFIKYLEDEMEPYLTFYSLTECAIAYDTLKKILNKYKEIIGIKDEIN